MNKEIFTYIDPSPPPVIKGGTLEGKTVSIQPNMSVGGWPTDAGSRALERFVALEDATVIERLRQSGAVITGSTHMSELGFGLTGDTAARAVADGQVDIALVTDTMGEARVAASMTNLFAFKPSYGIVSRFGLIGLVPSMECFAVIAKTLEEVTAVLEVIVGYDKRDFSMPDESMPNFSQGEGTSEMPPSFGVISECIESLETNEAKAFEAALARLEEMGSEVKLHTLADYDLFRATHNIIGSVEASSSAGKYDSVRYGHRAQSAKNWNEMYLNSRMESFGMLVKTYLFQGAYFQFENYGAFENACRIRGRLVRNIAALCEEVDALVFPTRPDDMSPDEAHTVHELYDVFSLTIPASVTGLPAVHIPGTVFGRETDPGLQLVASRCDDSRLLSSALRLTKRTKGDA